MQDYLSVLPKCVKDSLMLLEKEKKRYGKQVTGEVKGLEECREIQIENGLQELRFRTKCPIIVSFLGREYFLGKEGLTQEKKEALVCEREDIEDIIAKASRYSVYAYQEELKQGFFTLTGGHRLGLTGQAVMENGKILTFTNILSLCLRIAHEKKDCALPLLPCIFQRNEIKSILIISPPGGGKTTLLRDLIRQISNGTRFHEGMTVGVVDERWELGACFGGEVRNDLGIRTDVLCGGNKPEGMMLLLRSMAPQVIAVDEIGKDEDAFAIRNAGNSGCSVIASAHGSSFSEMLEKSCFRSLYEEKTFGLYVILGNRRQPGKIRQILDSEGRVLQQGSY